MQSLANLLQASYVYADLFPRLPLLHGKSKRCSWDAGEISSASHDRIRGLVSFAGNGQLNRRWFSSLHTLRPASCRLHLSSMDEPSTSSLGCSNLRACEQSSMRALTLAVEVRPLWTREPTWLCCPLAAELF